MSDIKDIIAEDFQLAAEAALKRNKNLLDTVSKLNSATAKLNRAVVKASTQCGCIELSGKRTDTVSAQIKGSLCASCRSVVEKEMGDALFYIAGIANALDISIYDVMLKEKQQLSLLKNFSLM